MKQGANADLGTYLSSEQFFDYSYEPKTTSESVLESGYDPTAHPKPTTSDYLV